jgi:hypothetical protein
VDYRRDVLFATDDWPFLYLRGRLIPDFTLRSMALLGVLGVGFVYLFLPKGRLALNSRMFFLGTAFMLLETKAVVQMAVLFGRTWLVNSAVFFTILVLILLANIYVLKASKLAIYQFIRIRQSGGSERPDRRSLTMRRSPLVNQEVLPLSSFLG